MSNFIPEIFAVNVSQVFSTHHFSCKLSADRRACR